MQDSEEDYTLIDTRGSEDYSEWHIKGAVNYPYLPSDPSSRVSYDNLNEEFGVEKSDKVITICAKGKSSKKFGKLLDEKEGFEDVAVVEGGMQNWSGVYDRVGIPTEEDDLEIVQLQRRAKGCLGYLIGSKSTDEAALVDVSRYTDVFLDEAEKRGYEIKHIMDTHIQADHLMGGKDLAKQLDVPYYLGFKAEERNPQFEYNPINDGETIEFGGVEIKAVHTPGHTSEMTSYQINDEAIITGDALFVESIGRTELEFGGEEAIKGAEMQYESIKTITNNPENMKVLPSHFTVTSEGEYIDVTPGKPIYSTIKYLKQNSKPLNMEKQEFVNYISDNLPTKPPNYEEIIAANTGAKEITDEKEAIKLELGPNRCAASEESMVEQKVEPK